MNKLFAFLTPRRRVYQVVAADNWSLHWDARYITTGLYQRHQLAAQITQNPWRMRHQILHFVDRYTYLHGPFKQLHPSNTVFLTWYHGDLDDPNPDMQRLFELLPQALPGLQSLVTSCHLSEKVLLGLGVLPEKIQIIPIGIDLTHFTLPSPAKRQATRAAFGIPENAVCIGSFQKDGQGWGEGLNPKLVKGPDIFLEVIAHLAKTIPNLIVFLTGPSRGYVKQGLEKIGVPYIHHFFQDYHDIARCYHALDLYIITSRTEGGPKALMESWATGVPLVSTRVGMPADLIRSGENGIIAEVEDVNGLVEGAKTLLGDANLQEGCRRNGLAAVQKLAWDLVADQHYRLYQPFLK